MAPPVFRFRSRTQEEFRIEGNRTFLRSPVIGDFAEWSRLRSATDKLWSR